MKKSERKAKLLRLEGGLTFCAFLLAVLFTSPGESSAHSTNSATTTSLSHSTNSATTTSLSHSTNSATAVAPSHSTDYISALSLYASGKQEVSYPLFENVIANEESSQNHRLRSAQVLAFAPNSGLTKHKRHFYAEYCLNQAHDLSPTLRTSLFRIAGDGLFDEMKLDQAFKNYTQMSQSPELKNQAYAQYRLGWIELNQENPKAALQRWAQFLLQKGRQLMLKDAELFRSILRDSGRAWIETAEKGQDAAQVFSPLSQAFPDYSVDLIDGLVQGMKRLSQLEVIAQIRMELQKSVLGKDVFLQLMKRGFVFGLYPCEVSNWSNAMQEAPKASLLPYLSACAKNVVEKKRCESADAAAARTLFEALELTEDELIPRINLSIECQQWATSCRDLIKYAIYQTESKTTFLNTQFGNALFETCAHSFTNKINGSLDKTSGALVADFLRLLDRMMQKGIFSTLTGHPVQKLFDVALGHPDFIRDISSQMLKAPASFQDQYSSLVEKVASRLTDSSLSLQFLNSFGKAPVQGLWLQILKKQVQEAIQKNDFTTARKMLDPFLPLNEAQGAPLVASVVQNEETSTVWEYYWFSLNQDHTDSELSLLLQTWMKHLPWDSMNLERKKHVFTLLLKFDQVHAIWNHWSSLGKALPKTNSAESGATHLFFEKTIQLVRAETASQLAATTSEPIVETIRPFSEGKIILRIADNDIHLTSNEVKSTLGPSFSFQPSQDLGSLASLRSLSSKLRRQSLKLNASMTRVLSQKIKLLQQEEGVIASTSWTVPTSKEKAELSYRQDCEHLIAELRELEKQLSENPEFADALEQIRQIETQVQDKIPGVQAPGGQNEKTD